MRFTKMHGLGNDYVYVNCFTEQVHDPEALALTVADRHTGIGSDGLILVKPAAGADAAMEIYNADGSRGGMCGNGIRCVAKLVIDHGLAPGPVLRIATDDGLKTCWCDLERGKVARVRVDVGAPTLLAREVPILVDAERAIDREVVVAGRPWRLTAVGLGNPHAVVFVEDLGDVDLARIGPAFERDPVFPQRVNAHFVRVDSRSHVTMKTWERGSGATRACGTGASAVCVAAAVTGRTDRKITATLPGGDLMLEWGEDDHVYKTGPAVEVFQGDWPGG